MAERNPVPARRQPADEIESPLEFGRQRHDADVDGCALNFRQDVWRCEAIVAITDRMRDPDPSRECSPRAAEACERLCAAELRADEVAFEMGR